MFDFNSKSYPESPWVYIWKKWKKVLYVWKAKNLRKRLQQYFRTWIWVWKEQMVMKADNIEYLLTTNEEEALLLEEKLVKKYNPPYNCLLKWDSSYVYIKIWLWDFPKIEFTHFKDKKAIYIWPKPWKKDLKNIFLILRKILKFRTCWDTKFKQWKLCSDYTLWLCSWWCVYNWIKEKQEYKKNINLVKSFFNWNVKSIQDLIKKRIDVAVDKENFEYAKILKDIYFKLEKVFLEQSVEFDKKINWYFIKIKKQNNFYFMIYVKFIDWKIIDIIKLKDNENNFLQSMINEWLIKEYKKLWENFYFWN